MRDKIGEAPHVQLDWDGKEKAATRMWVMRTARRLKAAMRWWQEHASHLGDMDFKIHGDRTRAQVKRDEEKERAQEEKCLRDRDAGRIAGRARSAAHKEQGLERRHREQQQQRNEQEGVAEEVELAFDLFEP